MKSNSMLLARALLVASVVLTSQKAVADDCPWWRFGNCEKQDAVEGLPDDAPRTGTLVTVDVAKNLIYLFQDGKIGRASCRERV